MAIFIPQYLLEFRVCLCVCVIERRQLRITLISESEYNMYLFSLWLDRRCTESSDFIRNIGRFFPPIVKNLTIYESSNKMNKKKKIYKNLTDSGCAGVAALLSFA